MPQLPYNFTGSVDVNVGDKEPENLNFLQRFSRGYVQSRQRVAQMNARERDPMYDLKQMMLQQHINQNALALSEALDKQTLTQGVRGGMQAVNKFFADTLAKETFGDDEWQAKFFDTINKFPLTDEQVKNYMTIARDVRQRRQYAKQFAGAPTGYKAKYVVDESTGEVRTTYEPIDEPAGLQVLNRAWQYEADAKRLETAGNSAAAADLRRKAADIRASVSKVEPTEYDRRRLKRERDNLAQELSKMKAMRASGTTQLGWDKPKLESVIKGLEAELATVENELGAIGGAQESNTPGSLIRQAFEQWVKGQSSQ